MNRKYGNMILAVTILSVCVFIILAVLSRKFFLIFERSRRAKRLTTDGIEAEAILLNLTQTGVYVDNLLQVKMQMLVYSGNERNFVAEIYQVVSYSDLSQLRVGGSLPVKYNPANTKEIMVIFPKIAR